MKTVKQSLALQRIRGALEQMQPLICSAENKAHSDPTTYGKLYRYVYEMGNALFDYGEAIPAAGDVFRQFAALHSVEGKVIARFPLPERNFSGTRGAYIHRAALRELLSGELERHILDAFHPIECNALTFIFAPEAYPVDHDNYVVKPIIDTVCTAFGIDDNGKELSICYYTECGSDLLSPWMYAILSAGPDCLPKSTALALAELVAPRKLNPIGDGN